jgi:catechol 2,3-dioxygenase-like lactoylglutathione lyase family enzyme
MPKKRAFRVLFVAGYGPIVRDTKGNRKLFRDDLGLPLDRMGDYLSTEKLDGVKHFGLWPLSEAAQAVFGQPEWPADLPVPQAGIEFDVDDIEAASALLKRRGYRLLVDARKEPWGQTVTRFLSPDGLLIGVTVTPWMRPKRRRSTR